MSNPIRLVGDYRAFIQAEIPRQRMLQPELTQAEYMRRADAEWVKIKTDVAVAKKSHKWGVTADEERHIAEYQEFLKEENVNQAQFVSSNFML